MRKRKRGLEALREIVFGLEDSLVSTLGTITGIAVGSGDGKIVILAGSVLVVVEAISMAAGSYLSTKSAYEAEGSKVKKTYTPVRASLVMLVFYLLGGCVPLIPYLVLPMQEALPVAILLATFTLFCLGFWKGRVVSGSPWKSGLEMTVVSLFAAGAGYVVGGFVSGLLQ